MKETAAVRTHKKQVAARLKTQNTANDRPDTVLHMDVGDEALQEQHLFKFMKRKPSAQ